MLMLLNVSTIFSVLSCLHHWQKVSGRKKHKEHFPYFRYIIKYNIFMMDDDVIVSLALLGPSNFLLCYLSPLHLYSKKIAHLYLIHLEVMMVMKDY